MVCSKTTTSLKKYQLSGKFRRKSTRACSFNNNDSNNKNNNNNVRAEL